MGASFDGDGVNFAMFSAHAEKVELCLFSADGRKEMARIALTAQTPHPSALVESGPMASVAPMAPVKVVAPVPLLRVSA